MTKSNRPQVAMIGLGRWGTILLGELEKQAEVLYVCSKSQDNTEQALADPRVEAVFIATPTNTHHEIAKRALAANKHIFLEKPGTNNHKDLQNLIDFANQKRLFLAIGYEYVHHPVLKTLKSVLQNKKIKKIIFEWHKWGTFEEDSAKHLLPHEISIAQFLGINLKIISCIKRGVISPSDILETHFEGEFSSTINRISPSRRKSVTIITDRDTYVWEDNDLFKIDIDSQSLEKIETPSYSSVSAEISDFLSSILEGRKPVVDGNFALKILEVIEQV